MKFNIKPKDFVSAPNIITYIRFALIPVIVWAYCVKESGQLTFIAVALSALTDVVDGKIARKYNMITDIGKVIDPIADKLTQAAMMFCLLSRYELMRVALIVLIVKEIFMTVTALMETKASSKINGSLWYGKACTVIIYSVVLVLLFIVNIPLWLAEALIIFAVAVMIISTILYGIVRFKAVLKKTN